MRQFALTFEGRNHSFQYVIFQLQITNENLGVGTDFFWVQHAFSWFTRETNSNSSETSIEFC